MTDRIESRISRYATPGTEDRVRELVAAWGAFPDEHPASDQISVFAEIADGSDLRPVILSSASRVSDLLAALDDARAALRRDIRVGTLAGLSESELARLTGLNRLTVRAALGK